MVSVLALALFVTTHAQAVAAENETRRLAAICKKNPVSVSCKTKVDVSKQAQPSKAWTNALASFVYVDPLYPGEPKRELVTFMYYAAGETNYDDGADGDHGTSGCSLGVKAAYWGHTVEDLKNDPGLCIATARKVIRWSALQNPAHPMAQYAGSAFDPHSIEIADARAEAISFLVTTLPPITEPKP